MNHADGEISQRAVICELLLEYSMGTLEPSVEMLTRLGIGHQAGTEAIAKVSDWRLAQLADADEPGLLLHAGKQFLSRRGEFPWYDLAFLPDHIDDLYSRSALRRAGFILLDDFRSAVLSGHEAFVGHARMVVPRAFEPAVDLQLAAGLHAAAAALTARLSVGEPPACVAEEILLVHLIEVAEVLLVDVDDGLTDDERREAVEALKGVFDLCGDRDVMFMFDMEEPADAAVAGHSPVYRVAGVADQRIEAWFTPFGYSIPTGHLNEEPLSD